ncbi:MAG: sugar phosphate isomerase/epimerase [Blautia sp.]|nr:sugar phosphate isomerase/epimerase [Blautia sp.]MCM1200756.1 sugar phosphate isomerase/epimerase [Bacteroides fragilis]
MLEIGVQTKNVVEDENPLKGFQMLRKAGFTCCDFSLNAYPLDREHFLPGEKNFFDRTREELEHFFTPHKEAAERAGVRIHQMHMAYPIYRLQGKPEQNAYLWNQAAPKSMELCRFFDCRYIVIHGLKLAYYLGSEELEWQETAGFIDSIAPLAKEMGITICIENLYEGIGGHIVEGPCCDVKKAVERIDRMNEKYHAEVLGFCFDTGHANLLGLDFEDFLTTLGHRLKVLHIHDNDGIGDLHQIPYTFTRNRENKSSTDWEAFIRGLGKNGFDKVLSFETAPALTAFPENLKQNVLDFLACIGKEMAIQVSHSASKG